MKATATALVFRFFGRNPENIKRWPSHVTTTRRDNTSNSGCLRQQGLNNKLSPVTNGNPVDGGLLKLGNRCIHHF